MAIIRKIYAFLIDTVQTFLLAASVFLVIYIFLFRPFEVDGLSMFPTFHNGDYVLTNLITLKLGNIKRGDVVVFVAPPDHQKDFIKRIIGLPGDTIMLKNGNVYLNKIGRAHV
ncbi:signal peptidase I, partial [Patescibacteria group bacterium]|nr:signal peptidase I [Patescibacteria group bacterium]